MPDGILIAERLLVKANKSVPLSLEDLKHTTLQSADIFLPTQKK